MPLLQKCTKPSRNSVPPVRPRASARSRAPLHYCRLCHRQAVQSLPQSDASGRIPRGLRLWLVLPPQHRHRHRRSQLLLDPLCAPRPPSREMMCCVHLLRLGGPRLGQASFHGPTVIHSSAWKCIFHLLRLPPATLFRLCMTAPHRPFGGHFQTRSASTRWMTCRPKFGSMGKSERSHGYVRARQSPPLHAHPSTLASKDDTILSLNSSHDAPYCGAHDTDEKQN